MDVRFERRAFGAGIAFAVLFVAGALVSFSAQADYDTDKDSAAAIARKFVDAAGDSGKQKAAVIGAYLLVAAALALVWFAVGLRSRLARSGVTGAAPNLVVGFGGLAAVATIAAAGLYASIPGSILFGDEPVPQNGDVIRLVTDLGTPMLLIGFALPMAALVAVTAYSARSSAALPRWLRYAGVLGVLGGLFAVLFLPMALLVLWVLATGITGVVGRPAAADVSVPAQTVTATDQSSVITG